MNNFVYITISFLLIVIIFFLYKNLKSSKTNSIAREHFTSNVTFPIPYDNANIVDASCPANSKQCADILTRPELLLYLPELYLKNTPGCKSCVVDKDAMAVRFKNIKSINLIINTLSTYMNNLLTSKSNNEQINLCISTLLNQIATQKYYINNESDPKASFSEAILYINLNYLPLICQSYILTNKVDITVVNYIKTIYNNVKPDMIKTTNCCRYGLGRNAFLCYFIFKNAKLSNDSINILKEAINILNFCNINMVNDGTVKSELDRGYRCMVYSSKAINYYCDMLNLRNIIGKNLTADEKKKINVIQTLTPDEKNKVGKIVNLLISIYSDKKYPNNLSDGSTIFQKKTKMPQDMLHDKSFNFLNYKFVIDLLTPENKKWFDNNISYLVKPKKYIYKNEETNVTMLSSSPLALGT